MKIHLPNSAFLGNIDVFLRHFNPSDPAQLTITANKKWISVHPLALAMVAALGLSVQPSKITCEQFEAKSKHYFERMGLFKLLKIPSGISITEHEPSGRFIPLVQIKTPQELSKSITELIPLLHLDPEQAKTIVYIISELVRNVLEHAQAKNGALLTAQYYSKSNAVRIGIVDTGVGVKQTINYSHHASSDLEALRLALTPGITGTTSREGGTELNAGAGLFFIKSIATVNRDFFAIYSGSALYKLLKIPSRSRLRLQADPFLDRHSTAENLPAWPGTAVGIDLTLDQTQEFALLLDKIRDTYSSAVRQRRQARYKKPRFV
jgi:anti-sigma regulatory factor (Ser/Thr protein kinase)